MASLRHAAPLRALTSWLVYLRHGWKNVIVVGVVNPTMFLGAMGLGLGSLVDASATGPDRLGGVPYLTFLAPGLLAASAVQTAAGEATWPVLAGVKWTRVYHAMLATPLRVGDVVAAQLLWVAARLTMVGSLFLAVAFCFGAVDRPEAVLAVPASVLAGLALASPLVAWSATLERDQQFSVVFRLGIMPMFLFSGTFFPLSQLPAGLRPLAWALPMWHGVDLCRSLALGTANVWGVLGHVAYLSVLVALGALWALRTFARRMTS